MAILSTPCERQEGTTDILRELWDPNLDLHLKIRVERSMSHFLETKDRVEHFTEYDQVGEVGWIGGSQRKDPTKMSRWRVADTVASE